MEIFEHLTWWRVVGLAYLAVFLTTLMFVIHLLMELCSTEEGRMASCRFFETRYSVRVHGAARRGVMGTRQESIELNMY